MDDRMTTGLRIVAAGVVAGIAGDGLLRAGPIGINVFLWAGLLVALVLWATKGRSAVSRRDDAVGALALLVFAAGFAWRRSGFLWLLDFGALGIVVSLAALRAPVSKLATSGLFDYARSSVVAATRAGFGAFSLVFGDIRWSETAQTRWPRRAIRVAIGTALAAPPLVVFAALLMAADRVFRHFVATLIRFNIANALSHAFLISFFGWIVAGTLRGIVFGKQNSTLGLTGFKPFALGLTEIGVALGLVDLLFLCFVVVEMRYFFGGASIVRVVPGLSYAEYARHGFFELCAVSGLVLPLLLAAHWAFRAERPADTTIFRVLAGLQVLLVFVIMLSAVERMRLYQREYGLTELRVYTVAFMAWLAIVFVWFVATVLSDHRERFAFGAMVAGFAGILILHAMNPDALIARTNIARAAEGKPFDAEYVANLGADAVPTLIASLHHLNAGDRLTVTCSLLANPELTKTMDWRTWNWSVWRAREAIERNKATLRSLSCTHP